MSITTIIDGRHFAQFVCGNCGIEHWVPQAFYDEQVKKGSDGGWHCPNGHSRVFRESEGDKLRRERDRLQQRLAEKDDEIRRQCALKDKANKRASAYKGQTTKLKKRASAGVCPCCNRTFENLARHMANKHPKFIEEDNVVPLKKETA